MDRSTQRFAYRCLPLTIANTHGWEMLSPCSFEAVWNGGASPDAVSVVRLGAGAGLLPSGHFGEGVLTLCTHLVLRTEQPYSLYVTGPVNQPKDGLYPLTGIVETAWLPFSFTMNWIFTRVGVAIRFEEGEPFCHFFPVARNVIETVEPEIQDIDADPATALAYREWSTSRATFNKELATEGTRARAEKWQRSYNRGTDVSGNPIAVDHKTRLSVREFVSTAAGAGGDPDASEAAGTLSSSNMDPMVRSQCPGSTDVRKSSMPPTACDKHS